MAACPLISGDLDRSNQRQALFKDLRLSLKTVEVSIVLLSYSFFLNGQVTTPYLYKRLGPTFK